MHLLKISIDRFIDGEVPGWVECSFVDADDRRHVFREKVPVVTTEALSAGSNYPRQGFIRCEIGAITPGGPDSLAVINTERIDGVTSTDGVSEFTVKPFDQLQEKNDDAT